MRLSYGSYTTIDHEPSDILADVEDAGFDGFEILSEGDHDLRDPAAVERFRDVDTELALTVHAPISDMNFGTLNREIWDVVVRQTGDVVEAAAEIGAERVTMHPGHYSPIGRRYRDRADERNLAAISRLVDTGEEAGVSVGIENLGGVDVFMGIEAEELFGMAGESGADVTLDFGHAHISGELDNFVENPDRIDHVHIHDNEGSSDQHLPLGEGKIPFDDLGEFFERYDGIFVIEGRSLEEGRRSLRMLRRLVSG